ncbi:MAG TPA: APC family permease, partial [Terriglobales bacterium]|nr:APC family permease [Terriglobales bacterium]
MALVRCIGRWTMTALVINCIIGGGIFGLPGELNRLLGRASPIAVLFAALAVGVMIACAAEVASQFSEAGGPYLYMRTAFGRFAGLVVGWIQLLSVTAGIAALSDLFATFFKTLFGWPSTSWQRDLLIAALIAVPAIANYRGVSKGAILNNALGLAKLAPLAVLIVLGVGRFAVHPQLVRVSEVTSPGISNWLRALVFLVSAFNGWEDSVVPSGETKDPRRTIPFGLGMALLACAGIYALIQFITVATIAPGMTDAPLQGVASVLIGRGGATFVTVAALISLYGWISAAMLYAPRLAYSLAEHGDFPAILARVHPRFNTPAPAIVFYAVTGWLLASSGTFLWLMALGAGTSLIMYAGMCCALIRLRKTRPDADALRIPFGPALSAIGVILCLALLTGLH